MKWAGAGCAFFSAPNQRVFSVVMRSMSFDLAAGSLPAMGASFSASSLAGTAGGAASGPPPAPAFIPAPEQPAGRSPAASQNNREAPVLRDVMEERVGANRERVKCRQAKVPE